MFNYTFNNSFNQIQFLLNELNNYAYKINEYIMQFNNIMNQIMITLNNQFNEQNKIINKPMNMMDISSIKLNMNNVPNYVNNNDIFFSFQLRDSSGNTFLQLNGNKTINDLINDYLRKKNKIEYINNYDTKFNFLFNAQTIQPFKNIQLKDFFRSISANNIQVNELN